MSVSYGSEDLTTTEKASVNTEVDNALDTAIPASPTAASINKLIKDHLGVAVAIDSVYPEIAPASGDNAFGSWVEWSADIGTGKRIMGAYIKINNTVSEDAAYELEIGEGAAASESAVTRVLGIALGTDHSIYVPLGGFKLTDNARISARIRDEVVAAVAYGVMLYIGG